MIGVLTYMNDTNTRLGSQCIQLGSILDHLLFGYLLFGYFFTIALLFPVC